MATKKVKKIPTNAKLDNLIEQVEGALASLDATQHYLALAADGLGVKHHDDPYLRGALHGILPPATVRRAPSDDSPMSTK